MHSRSQVATFRDWTNDRKLTSLGTNSGAQTIPFQNWRRIKEAFAPELIARAIKDSSLPVQNCIDPFGGSGTTGLACQFLGVHPVLVEVNPYLADLIEAKLTPYKPVEQLLEDLDEVIKTSSSGVSDSAICLFATAPSTFVEPGNKGRWIFDRQVAERIAALHNAINCLDKPARRLFLVLLGGILIEVSNVRVSGKGRRYRRRWKERIVTPTAVEELFSNSAKQAIEDIRQFSRRATNSFDVLRGDCKAILDQVEQCELAVFSPPYPNSFDYTDVYNVELWTLGYLDSTDANLELRSATLSSHVQVSRDFLGPPTESQTLNKVLERLNDIRHKLWDSRIPSMVGAYFTELMQVLNQLSCVLTVGGSAWIVVGESCYGGVKIPVATVLEELATCQEWRTLSREPVRFLRSSAQQGGQEILSEQLLVLQKEP